MTPDKSKTMDAAEKLMLDLMEKHPGGLNCAEGRGEESSPDHSVREEPFRRML